MIKHLVAMWVLFAGALSIWFSITPTVNDKRCDEHFNGNENHKQFTSYHEHFTHRYSSIVSSHNLPFRCACAPHPSKPRPALGVFVVCKDDEESLDKLLQSFQTIYSDLFGFVIIDQGSTDNSVDVAQSHGAHVIKDEISGYSELSHPRVYNVAHHLNVDWMLLFDADEIPTQLFLSRLALLLRGHIGFYIDGFVLYRCNNSTRHHVFRESKYRLFRVGRAIPRQGLGTQFLPVCHDCWKPFQPYCSIWHDKSADQQTVDAKRYRRICNEACQVNSSGYIQEHYPDCWYVDTCQDHFPKGFKRPLTDESTWRLRVAQMQCYTNYKVSLNQSMRWLKRVRDVLINEYEGFLPEWTGNLLFVINNGRSGSKYLSHILSLCSNAYSVHEPSPIMDSGCGQLHYVPREATYEFRLLKAAAIEESINRSLPQIYAETNPNFKHSFFDVVLNEFKHIPINVIILRRKIPSIVKSLRLLGWMVPRSKGGKGYSSSIAWQQTTGSINSPIFSPKAEHMALNNSIKLLVNYALNTEAVAKVLRSMNTSVIFWSEYSENLFTREGSLDLLSKFGCFVEQYSNVSFLVWDHFKSVALSEPSENLYRIVFSYINALKEHIKIPAEVGMYE